MGLLKEQVNEQAKLSAPKGETLGEKLCGVFILSLLIFATCILVEYLSCYLGPSARDIPAGLIVIIFDAVLLGHIRNCPIGEIRGSSTGHDRALLGFK
jgi:hypothetical protein